MSLKLCVFLVICALYWCSAKDLRRSKRQMQVYYMCNGAVSQFPCSNNCQNNNCNYGNIGSLIIPNNFYSNSYSNCNSGCNNLNCNQYNGQWINGQYVAYSMGSNVYSPCASSCCSTSSYNPYQSNNFINLNNQLGNVPSPTYSPYGRQSFPGTYQNGVYMCGGVEPSGGVCQNNGICPSGHSCIAGNVCCRCPVGASAGSCQSNDHCQSGYQCSATGFCCPSQVKLDTELKECLNGQCITGFTCGIGNLCYPDTYLFN